MSKVENYNPDERMEHLKKLSTKLTVTALTEGVSEEEIPVLLEFFKFELNFKHSILNK